MIALTDELNLRLYGIQVPCGSAEHSDSRPWGRNPPRGAPAIKIIHKIILTVKIRERGLVVPFPLLLFLAVLSLRPLVS